MTTPERYVIDTNVLVSFLLFYGSVPGQAVKAWRTGVLLRSDSTLSELARALERPTFDRYLTRYERAIFRQRFIQDTGEPRRETHLLHRFKIVLYYQRVAVARDERGTTDAEIWDQ
jgi:predicted nucleic acid-binding protein